jgi:tetratricopeptide (TPR) repeat protein
MLQNHLTKPLSDSEQHEAKDLLRELSYLPIAVVHAAACMNATSMTVQEYRAQLDEHKDLALGYNRDPSQDSVRSSSVTNPVATTLSVSIHQISCSDASTADYLSLAACVARKDISVDLLEAASPQTREDAIKVLDKYALITRRPADSAIDLHRLVHQTLRKRLQMQGQLVQWAQIAISQLILVFPDDGHGNRSKWRRLLPHVRCAMSHIPADHDDDSDEKSYLAWKCAMALNSDGRYEETGKLQVEVMQSRRRVLDNQHPFTLSIMNNLALTYDHQGRWQEAEELQVQVMHTMKRVLGNEHPYTLAGTLHLSLTYSNQGRLREAKQLQMQVMQTRKRLLGSEHPDTLTSMNNLALTCKKQGRWREAEELEMQVMHKRKRVLGDVHPSTLISMGNLALTYSNQGRWKAAETLQTQVVETTKRVLGDAHPFTLNSLSTLAQACWDRGRFKEAEELQEQVLKTSKRVLGDEHPDTLETMHNLACVLQSQARYKEAIGRMEKCFQSRQQVLGEQHPDTQSSLDMLNNWQSECN